jgi:hypothetical protein
MQIVINDRDFKNLSRDAQSELITLMTGSKAEERPVSGGRRKANMGWRRPVDLSPDVAARLLHGLSDENRQRLKLFAQKGGRVKQRELLAVTNQTDLRALSHFQSVLTRRLRRLLNDPEKKAHLIGWDYNATEWNPDRTEIVDGIYFVSDRTAKTLSDYFHS